MAKVQNINNSGCMAFFGLPFFLIGLGALYLGLSMFYGYLSSANWLRLPATIHEADITQSRDSDGDATYRLTGSYSYTYQKKPYTSQQITFEKGSSSAYGEKKEMLDKMNRAIKANKTLDAYVNPDNPQQAVLFRQITMGMVLATGVGLLFSLVGFVLTIVGIKSLKDSKQKKEKIKLSPGCPWKADSRWNGFMVKTNEFGNVISSWVIAVSISVFVSIFVLVLWFDSSAPFFAWAVIGLFGLFAVLAVCSAIYQTLKFFKFGESQLVLKQLPLVPGREFKAILLLPPPIKANGVLKLELLCEKGLTTGSGKNRHTNTSSIFKDAATANLDRRNRLKERLFVPVAFNIPADCETDSPSTNPSFTWKLKAVADLPGVDYSAEFPLPVFAVSSDEDIEYKD